MWMVMIAAMLQCLQFCPWVLHRNEFVDIRELITQAIVDWRDALIVDGLSGLFSRPLRHRAGPIHQVPWRAGPGLTFLEK